MPDDVLADIRRLLGRSDSRYGTVRLAALEGPTTQVEVAERLSLSSPTAKELLERLSEDGFIRIDTSGRRPRYFATAVGVRLIVAIEAARSDAIATDLIQHVLVCVTRPRGSLAQVRDIMLAATTTLFTGYGSFHYAGVCVDDPELVAELQERVEALGADTASFRATALVPRAR